MFEDVQSASAIRSTPDPPRLRWHQYSFPEPKANPFEVIALDFITKLPKSQKYDSILTITDHDCSKASLFIPCMEEITAEEVAKLFVQRVFRYYRLPQKIISDRTPDSHQSLPGSCATS